MTATDTPPEAARPAGLQVALEVLVDRWLDVHAVPRGRARIRREWRPARECDCERPMPFSDDAVVDWERCLRCGRTVR